MQSSLCICISLSVCVLMWLDPSQLSANLGRVFRCRSSVPIPVLVSRGHGALQAHPRQCKATLSEHPAALLAGEGGPQTGTMTECFDCDNCKESLYGRKYIQMDNGPYCIPCYDAHFANTCDECKELIGHDCRVSMGTCRAVQSIGAHPHLILLSSPGAVL